MALSEFKVTFYVHNGEERKLDLELKLPCVPAIDSFVYVNETDHNKVPTFRRSKYKVISVDWSLSIYKYENSGDETVDVQVLLEKV